MKDDQTRRQVIRDAVREMLPEVLAEVVKQQQYENLTKKVESRLTEVEKYVKDTADLMNARQKEVLKFLLESYAPHMNEEAKETLDEAKTLANSPTIEEGVKDIDVSSFRNRT